MFNITNPPLKNLRPAPPIFPSTLPEIKNEKIRKELQNKNLTAVTVFKDGILCGFENNQTTFFSHKQLHALTLKQEFVRFFASSDNLKIVSISFAGAAAQTLNNINIVLAAGVAVQAPLVTVAASTAPTVVGIPLAAILVAALAYYTGHKLAQDYLQKTEKQWAEDLGNILQKVVISDQQGEKFCLGEITKVQNSRLYKNDYYLFPLSIAQKFFSNYDLPNNQKIQIFLKELNPEVKDPLNQLIEQGRVKVLQNLNPISTTTIRRFVPGKPCKY